MAAPKVMLLTGAPLPYKVDEASCTVSKFDAAYDHLLDIQLASTSDPEPNSSHAVWRSLPLTRQPLHTGFSQVHEFHDTAFRGSAGFFTTADVSFSDLSQLDSTRDEAEDVLTQFCEQALAEHTSMMSSQADDTVMSEETSFLTTTSSADRTGQGTMLPPPPPVPSHLSDLEDVPPAKRILALQPQTVTLNLIVGVISIAQPRTVTTRWGKTLSLVEVLVGDETATGFGVTFWIGSDADGNSGVSKLQRQDVVLMENVALHVFRDKVYGQSLRKDLTRINLLWRRDGSGYYSTRSLSKSRTTSTRPQQEKTRMVKDWVLHFVGRDPARTTRSSVRRSWDRPPDDSQ
ncbi:nucleic acid-binding, OB-fold protein [Purpureocillium lavendulum]|uniref:Nucleic acid-binding, OB-fold protein n=1 Tax=Purpureocillium lavendulum TaxID=1247861 RepID=A0AB34FUT3_9HYPO|nr:nucleic acid-binding, OB-fold protein [Purpureocillium lavendulum]